MRFKTFIFLLFSNLAFCKQNQFYFKHLLSENGLSQNSVEAIYQDQKGFMWFGTHDGLNRYDANQFKIFRKKNGNPNSLPNNYIWDIYEDDQNQLWVATFGGGLAKINLQTEQITNYHKDAKAHHIPSSRIFKIVPGSKNILWLGSNEGLIKLDTQTGFSQLYFEKKSPDGNTTNHYTGVLAADSNNNIWLRTDEGLAYFEPITENITYFTQSPFSAETRLGDIYDIKTLGTKIYIACDAGFVEINPMTKSDRLLVSASDFKNKTSEVSIRNILPLEDDVFLLGSHSGLIYFDKKTNFKQLYQANPDNKNSLSHNHILSLYQSKDHVIWIGTRKGLNKLETLNPDFFINPKSENPDIPTPNNVYAFAQTNDTLLWIGSPNGLSLLNKKTQQYLDIKTQTDKITTPYILCLYTDSKNQLWIGTRYGGLYKVDANLNLTKIAPENIDASKARIHFITEDQNGQILLGTGGDGLWHYNPETNRAKVYPTAQDGSGPSHPYVFCVLEDSQQHVWLGTATGGLNIFDRETNRFYYFQHDPATVSSIADNLVLCLFESSDNTLWIGTVNGLSKLNRPIDSSLLNDIKNNPATSISFENYYQKDGFPNEVIYGILEDENGYLWLSTNKGIAQFDPKNKKVINTYTQDDGLQGNEFNQNAYYQSPEGEFYFGGVIGYNHFKPEQITGNKYPSPVVFTDLSIFNKPVFPTTKSTKNAVLDKTLHYKDTLFLSWKHKVITVGFANLNFRSPEKNNFYYRLVGFDEDWVFGPTAQRVTYTNLKPGDYRLEVQGINSSGRRNTEASVLHFNINPPPWATWYAYTFYVFVALLLGYGYVRLKVNKATQKIKIANKLENARIEEREAFRKRSAKDFHDESGNKITRLNLLTQLVKKEVENQPDIIHQIQKIEQNLIELNNGMRDFIWALDPGKDSLYETLIRFVDFASAFCEDAQVRFYSDPFDEHFKNIFLDMSRRRHLLLIMKEALNNSIKHANAKRISLEIIQETKTILLKLIDDGKGFNTQNEAHGNGLIYMKERATQAGFSIDLHSIFSKGTTIILGIKLTQLGEET